MNRKKENEDKKRRRIPEGEDIFTPFRLPSFHDLETYINEMHQRMISAQTQDRTGYKSKYQEGPFFYGYSYQIGPDGTPHYKEFSNFPDHHQKLPEQPQKNDPFIDIQETDKEIFVTIELPGVSKEHIDIDLKDKTLTLIINHPEQRYTKNIDLPNEVLEKKTEATYNNGVLSITLKKRKTKNNGTKINIK